MDARSATTYSGGHSEDVDYVSWNPTHTELFCTSSLRVIDYPALTARECPVAHVGGCVALALDPRGRYLASGGLDSIINMFDLNNWICARTISICECVNYALAHAQRISSFA